MRAAAHPRRAIESVARMQKDLRPPAGTPQAALEAVAQRR